MTAPVDDPVRANWRDLVPHEPGRLILSILSFREYLVRLERKDGLPRIVVRHRGSGDEHAIDFDEEAFSLACRAPTNTTPTSSASPIPR